MTTVFLKDYEKSNIAIHHLNCTFYLNEEEVIVEALLDYEAFSDEIYLNGEDLDLLELKINNNLIDLSLLRKIEEGIKLNITQKKGYIFQKIKINPSKNYTLSGLYRSGKMLCTQCEAEGFRRIIYYPDRPDVQSVFTIKLIANKEKYPILLSNGNLVGSRDLDNGFHETIWHDPYPKPSYLFALVAGNLALTEGSYKTKDGRDVVLKIFTDLHEKERTGFALEALKKSIKWDEDTYGLCYDLNVYHIVATHDFNMGAMENKSLNIFNAKYVLGDEKTATDEDYQNILSVVGHEYFHNYTGNRVTLRDWFQLSLKEGLTVFREQQFAADMIQSPVSRIQDVIQLLSTQFPEDASPLAHPVRPQSYQAIDNFYTATIYEKGAEIIRMLKLLIGDKDYYQGVHYYLTTFDGKSATIEDWIASMEIVSKKNLKDFSKWYDVAKTPTIELKVEDDHFILTQHHPDDMILTIPMMIAQWNEKEQVQAPLLKILTEKITKIPRNDQDLITLNHQFSAPVHVVYPYSKEERRSLMMLETDSVILWIMMQEEWYYYLIDLEGYLIESDLIFIKNLIERNFNDGLTAFLLQPPTFEMLLLKFHDINPIKFATALKNIKEKIASLFKNYFIDILKKNVDYNYEPLSIDQRRLQKIAISYLSCDISYQSNLLDYLNHPMMTLNQAALNSLAINDTSGKVFNDYQDAFIKKYQDQPLLVSQWLRSHAMSCSIKVENNKLALEKSHFFDIKNPNKVYALFLVFSQMNLTEFHRVDGTGYDWWALKVIELDNLNPQVAARLAKAPRLWKKWDQNSRNRFQESVKKYLLDGNLSNNTKEIIEQLII